MNNDRKDELDGLAVGLLVLCCALWGLAQVAAKVALEEIPPLMQAALRSAGAAVLLLAWSAWRELPIIQRDGALRGGLAAGLLFAAEFALIFIGLQYTAASRIVVFIYLSPFVVALGMPLISRQDRLDAWQWGGLMLAFAGVVWAFSEGFAGPTQGPRQWLGDALGIAAGVTWGLTTLVLRGTRLSMALPEKALLYQLGVSAVALGAGSLASGEAWPSSPSTLTLASLAFQTVIVTFASFLAWFWLVRHYPTTRLSSFTLLTPLFGLLSGVLLLGEPLTLRLAVAVAAVTAGIALVNRRPARG